MAANMHSYVPGLAVYESRSYNVSAQSPTLIRGNIPEAGFAGVFPDGSRAMTNGPPSASESIFFPVGQGNVPALLGPAESHLIDLATGSPITAMGWDVTHAQMPMFSPDGRHLVYNDYDQGGGHSLWVADFDAATNTFSNKREIFSDSSSYPGWPFFTPDSKAVVFALGTRPDFVSQIPNPVTIVPPDQVGRSHLEIVYVNAPGQSTRLDAASGYMPGGNQTYVRLPTVPAPVAGNEPLANEVDFFPTVSPVAAGGYFWVFFTSRRTYGNLWPHWVEDAPSKKIWVAAVDIQGSAGTDPSHPAFYLPGQELESGNLRAFAALEPCKENGGTCTSGTQCCEGFCVNGVCGPPQMCAQTDDACETDADCCDASLSCIAGFCSLSIPR